MSVDGTSAGGCFAGCDDRGSCINSGVGWRVFGSGIMHNGAERCCHNSAPVGDTASRDCYDNMEGSFIMLNIFRIITSMNSSTNKRIHVLLPVQ